MITVGKVCCCELKWGALIIAIIDLILTAGGVGPSMWMKHDKTGEVFFYLCLIVYIAHIVACILMIISVFVNNKLLMILYLITQIIRIIFCIIIIIWVIILLLTPRSKAEEAADIILERYGNKYTTNDLIITLILGIVMLVLGIWFWIIGYSWYRNIGGSTPVD